MSSGSTAVMTLHKCEVCGQDKPIYTCPRCEVRTCSLQCVRIHKNEIDCCGTRDATGYVPIKKFSNLNLLSDYRLLEDITRNIENCRRDPQRRYTRYNQPLPTHLYRLKSAAQKRKITLQFLPQHFKRHKENRTILNYDTQIINWKLDFVFPQGEMVKSSDIVDESTKLVQVLDKYINPVDCPGPLKSMLKFYHSAGLADVVVLLKAERVQSASFYNVDMFSSISNILAHHLIIEHPVFYVIRKSYIHEYTIIEDNADASELDKGPKHGYFGDFTPVNFFTELNEKKKKPSEGDVAKSSILESAAILRGRQITQKHDPEHDEEEIQPHRKEVWIPSYDSLCSKLN